MIRVKEFITLPMGDRIAFFQESFGQSQELIIRPLRLRNENKTKAALMYINNIVNTTDIQQFILRPLIESTFLEKDITHIEDFIFNTVQITKLIKENDPQKLIDALLLGNTLLLVENVSSIYIADTPDWQKRSLSSPESDRGRGSLIAFSEDLQMNINVIRRVVKNNHLIIETNSIGEKTKTNYSIIYAEDLVDRIALDELYKKLKEIKLEFVLDTNYLIENLQGKNKTPFPMTLTTERPDRACSAILQGRIVIVLEGTPYVIILPVVLPSFLHASDDYFVRWEFGINRILRLICLLITLYTPGLYISLVCFHEEMLPSAMYYHLIAQSEGVPFPLTIEVCLLSITLQVIIDALFRMNRDLILVISILATFIIGDVAVSAGLIRPASIIVIAITFIAGFIQPKQQDLFAVIRNLRFIFLLIGNLLGLYGLIIVTFFLLLHLSSLRSFGIPYLAPVAPINLKEQKDTFIRSDINSVTNSPHHFRHEELMQEKSKQNKK